MNTLDAFERDIGLQLDFLKSFKRQRPLSNQKDVIFSGSGDSLASAMLAESFSGVAKAADPLDLYRNRHLLKSHRVYLVSVSGNTATNVRVARAAEKAIAITSKAGSRLARASDGVILLDAPGHGVFTAGSVSFLESALTCISLVKRFRMPDPSGLFSKARADAKRTKISERIFVLGTLHTYPLAMYCAAKFYEILGYDAHYSKIEQFSHMELFSAKRGDTVIIFEESNAHNRQLAKNLRKIGINVIHPAVPSGKISQMLYCTFFSQLLALFAARRKGRKECHFVTAKKIRNASNLMIY